MKRWVFIVGIVFIVLLTGVWMYLLFFGAPTSGGIFNAFNFNDTTEEGIVIDVPEVEAVVDTNSPERLRQLTIRKVIGHAEVASSTASTSLVYFAEAGTGHIYTIDLVTGVEERISNITIPKADEAAISSDGSYAAVAADGKLSLITLPHGTRTLASEELTSGASHLAFSDDTLLYSITTGGATQAKSVALESNTTKTLFEVPFRESVIVWGETPAATHYAYPKTTARLEGYYYAIKAGVLDRLPISGYGFNVKGNGAFSLYSERQNDRYQSFIFNHATGDSTSLGTALLPEKCTFSNTTETAVCAIGDTSDPQYPDVWYKGVLVSSDDLWSFDMTNNSGTFVLDLEEESVRRIDVTDLQPNTDDTHWYFINKIDQALWLFDRTISE
ncbi:MAG TPA: hypothetical protein VGE31_02720 [Candidatus Paceibacterota bacterium]